jgi:DNA-binding response OmpR family regulator
MPSALRPPLLAISIRDTGVGIPDQALPHLFDYFYRYRDQNARRESGTGIGLALSKELVELHHGKISMTSVEGKGSEFVVHLPLGKSHLKPEEIAGEQLSVISDAVHAKWQVTSEPEADIPAIHQSTDPTIQRSSGQRPVILLVEDNSDMRRYLREKLRRDYDLLEAANGEEGLQQAVAEIPDLIVSDVMMPQMDGMELCRELKTNELTSHIPVILLTARGSGESKLEGLELGADDYLTKPMSGRELRLRVRNLIARQRQLQHRFRMQLAGLDGKPTPLSLPSADEKFLQRATEVAEKLLMEPEFGPERFAHELALSRAHLNRKLRGLLGQRTGDFLRTLRLKRAAELLHQKSGTVSEIAFQVGFNHLSYFARSFKAQYGQSPSEYGQ